MKRILIVFSMMLALGVSAPFAFAAGSDSFDKNSSLEDNIFAWLTDSKNYAFELDLESDGYFDITMICLNMELGLNPAKSIAPGDDFTVVKSMQLPGDLSVLLSKFVTPTEITSVQYFMFGGKQTLEYEWNGNLISVVPGSIFMGFCLGGDCEGMDMVLLLTPSQAPVPVPAAVWLLGSGIAGLGVLRRKLA